MYSVMNTSCKYKVNGKNESIIKKGFMAFVETAQSSYLYTFLGFIFCGLLVAADYGVLVFNRLIINNIWNLELVQTPNDNTKYVITLIIFVSVIIVFKGIIEIIDNYYGQKRLSRFQQYIDERIVWKCKELDISVFDSPQFYNQLEQVNSTKRMLGFFIYRVLFLVKALFMIMPALVIIISSQWYIAIAILMLMIPSIFHRGKCDGKMMEYDSKNRDASRKMSYWCRLVFGKESAKELRLYNFTDYVVAKYEGLMTGFLNGKKKIIRKYGCLESLVKVLPFLAVFAGGVILVIDVTKGVLEPGDFLYFIGIYIMLINNLDSLFQELATVKQHMFAYDKYREFLRMETIVKDNGTQVLNDPKVIEFDNVWFRYPRTDKDVLKGFSCLFRYNEKNAIIGLNGAGKTTIIKLLLRFYDPDEGKILIDGIDIKEYSIESLRKCFGVTFQDFNIFSVSLRENIAFSNWEECNNDERIKESLEYTGFQLDCDLDCEVGKEFTETGRGLSGGEAQKIAIARCVFSSANFLIMDEPTAALDAYAENALMQKFEEYYKDKGLIIISHRLRNVKGMDNIFVISDGKLLEKGNHDQLMELQGEYHRLFMLQAEKYE